MKWDTTKKLQTEFIKKDQEVTEEKYYEMLEVLPPFAMVSNAFLVGEPTDYGRDLSGKFNARYSLYFQDNSKCFYGGETSINDFKTFLIEV
jgi:hypothetical protein